MEHENLLEKIFEKLEELGCSPKWRNGDWIIEARSPDYLEESNPSFKIHRDGHYHHFSANVPETSPWKHGTLEQLARLLGLEEGREERPGSTLRFTYELGGMKEYLKRRLAFVKDGELVVFTRKWGIGTDAEHRRILFQWHTTDGHFQGYVEHFPHTVNISGKKKYNLPEGSTKDHPLFLNQLAPLSKLPESEGEGLDEVILTEGVFDALSFIRAGFPAVAVLGKVKAENVVNTLINHTEFRRVILAFDGDKSGRRMSKDFFNELVRNAFKVGLVYFPDGKDPNDILQEKSVDGFRDYVKNHFLRESWEIYAWLQGYDPKRLDELERASRIALVFDFIRFEDGLPAIARDPLLYDSQLEKLAQACGLTDKDWMEIITNHEQRLWQMNMVEKVKKEGLDILNKIDPKDPDKAWEEITKLDWKIKEYQTKFIETTDWYFEDPEALVDRILGKESFFQSSFFPGFRFRRGDLALLKGQTGYGKTTIALNLAHEFIQGNRIVFYFTYEFNREEILREFLKILKGEEWLKALEKKDRKRMLSIMADFIDSYKQKFLVFYGIQNTIEIESIIAGLKRELRPPDLIIFDYDMWLQPPGRFETTERKVDAISKFAKNLAVNYNTVVLLLSQVNKSGEAKWGVVKEEDASVVVNIEKIEGHNDETVGEFTIELKVEKSRNGKYGDGLIVVDKATRRIIPEEELKKVDDDFYSQLKETLGRQKYGE